jgi:molybdenum cofactor biosynthesis enzyme MoaA
MKTHTFSIVVGDARCDFNCPYCISKMTLSEPTKPNTPTRWDRFDSAMRIVEMAADGLVSALLTGKGEPCLFPHQISAYLSRMEKRFPLVDLQTNGFELAQMPDSILPMWADLGLTLVCVSVAHYDARTSNVIMGAPTSPGYNYWDLVDKIHNAGLACRINCTMVHGGVETGYDVGMLIDKCRDKGVEQLTIRRVAKPSHTRSCKISGWVDHNLPAMSEEDLYLHLRDNGGKELLKLPHGASVFDMRGQNVCVGNCITSTTDPNDIRQIIFFPDGRIAYDWKYPGARIL